MRTVEISEAAGLLPTYGRRKPGEVWVLTRGGRPVAAVVPIDDEDHFSLRLANDPRFMKCIERARASYRTTGGTSLAEMREKHVAPAEARRPATRRKPR